MKQLLIRADDLGYSDGVNYGIAKAVNKGVVKSVGVMTNMPTAMDGLKLLKKENVCLGQHTNICVGKPITDPALIPTLCKEDGCFKTSREYRKSKTEGIDFVNLDEVVMEIEAQYKKFIELTGKRPEYFEGHAVASDNFFKGLKIVAERYNLPYLNMPKEQKILCICGIKNSGKTTYIEKLLKEIKSHGKSAAVIKHDGHDFEGDRPGTDTYRYHQAGAAATAIFSKNRYMINADEEIDLQQLINGFSDADVILVEGMKQSELPKIEIVREKISCTLSCCGKNLIAVVTDCEADFDGIEKWPLEDCSRCLNYLLQGGLRC